MYDACTVHGVVHACVHANPMYERSELSVTEQTSGASQRERPAAERSVEHSRSQSGLKGRVGTNSIVAPPPMHMPMRLQRQAIRLSANCIAPRLQPTRATVCPTRPDCGAVQERAGSFYARCCLQCASSSLL